MQATANAMPDATANNRGQCESTTSAVAWPAIIAGAFTAAAVSLILLLLGSGFGLASVSPWAHAGVSAVTFTATTAIWLIAMQWIASGFGGYLTGRLRSKWVSMHTDEVFFRDTAHGFLAWALATVFTAMFLASAISSIVGSGTRAATTMATSAAAGASRSGTQDSGNTMGGPTAYFVDSLFRSVHANPNASENDVRGEATRILVSGIKDSSFPDADKVYLSELVASRTGLSQTDAARRVDDVITQFNAAETKLRQEADTARKTASTVSIFTALSMLIGAFIASVAAALGGKRRDEY